MGENLDKYEIKDHAKRREREKRGHFIGVELLNGDKVFGTLEESRPNILFIKCKGISSLREVHRALVKRFMFLIEGGNND